MDYQPIGQLFGLNSEHLQAGRNRIEPIGFLYSQVGHVADAGSSACECAQDTQCGRHVRHFIHVDINGQEPLGSFYADPLIFPHDAAAHFIQNTQKTAIPLKTVRRNG